jgi:hypothetical protein
MGGLIDAVARSAGVQSYGRGAGLAQDHPNERVAYDMAWEIAEDIHEMDVDIGLIWEKSWIRLSWPGGRHFGFACCGPDEFKLSLERPPRVLRRLELFDEIAAWIRSAHQDCP